MRTLTTTPRPRQTNVPPPGLPPAARARRPFEHDRRAPTGHGALARARRAAAELTPETIERIAQRVAQLLRHEPQRLEDGATARDDLIDTGQLARHLGVTRAWIYEHADELGAMRLGCGSKARLRFDLDTATEALAVRERGGESEPGKALPRPQRPRHYPPATTVPLLPVHEPHRRGIFGRRCML